MRRRLLTITAAVLVVAALSGWMWFLYQRTLDQADQWTSVVGLFVTIPLTVAALVLSWRAWRAGTAVDLPSGTGAGPSPGEPGQTGAITLQEQVLTDRVQLLGAQHPDTLTTAEALRRWQAET